MTAVNDQYNSPIQKSYKDLKKKLIWHGTGSESIQNFTVLEKFIEGKSWE